MTPNNNPTVETTTLNASFNRSPNHKIPWIHLFKSNPQTRNQNSVTITMKIHTIDGDHFKLENLPTDILLDILTRLPISSLIQLRLLFRRRNLLSIHPELPQLHHSTAANDDPLLMFHCNYPLRNQLSFVELSSGDDDNRNTVRKISTPFCSSMPEFTVVGSCNGLLCLSDSFYGEPIYVFNPFTRDHLQLPRSKQFQEQEIVFGFGFQSVTNEYKLVKIVYYRNPTLPEIRRRRIIPDNRSYPKSEVQILTISDQRNNNSWRYVGEAPYQVSRQSTEAPLVNGRIHWLSRLTIVSFDLIDERFKPVAKPSLGGAARCSYQLTVVRGWLALVISCGYGKVDIWVMKEYGIDESWVKEFVIDGVFTPSTPVNVCDHRIWRRGSNRRAVRVLCVLKSGKILMEYRGGCLVKYDPKGKELKNVVFSKMPRLFETIVHVGTLNWIHKSI